MKEGWKYKKLGEVCEIFNGNSINADYKRTHFFGATEGLPFIATKDVSNNGSIDYDNGVRIPNYEEYKVAPANSVFVCAEGGSAGKKFAFVEQDVCFGNKLFCLNPKNNSLVGKYIYYFVQSEAFKEQFYALLTGLIGGVSAKKFQQIEIPVTSVDEQRSIVSRLDAAFASIDALKANADKQLAEALALFQKALKEAMTPKEGWTEKSLKDVCDKITDGSHNPPKGIEFSEYKMLSSQNVQNGFLDLSSVRYLSEDDFYTENKRTNAQKGDILLTIVGTIGRSCVLTGMEGKITFQRSVAVLKPLNAVDSYFLMYYLWSMTDYLNRKAQGAAQKGIYLKQLAKINLTIPSIEAQQSIVTHLNALSANVRKLEEIQRKTIIECDALKQALLKETFE